MSEVYNTGARVYFTGGPVDWRDEDDEDLDDEELEDTPSDVVAVLGFDPKAKGE